MKCLVTGGAGFIGSNLVMELINQGHTVSILDDLSTGCEKNLDGCKGIDLIIGDLRLLDHDINLTKNIDVIFHLAASVGNARSIAHPHADANTNVLGTISVLESARRNDIRKVIYSSSAGIFGELKTKIIKEDHPRQPDSPYGCTKLYAENLCLAYNKLYNMENTCLRYFNVYGPKQRYDAYGNVIPIFAKMLLAKTPLTVCGNGEQTRDFVNVRDVVQANFLAATVPNASGVYNIGSGIGTSINRLVDIMGNTDVVYVKPRPGDVLHSTANIEKAKKELGYLPSVTLTEGIKEYLDWFKQDQATEALTML